MRRTLILAILVATVLVISIRPRAQVPAGRVGLPLSQVRWQTWNNPGLRGYPVNVDPDGPAPRRDLTGIWDAAGAGIQPRGATNPAPLTDWGKRLGDTHKSGDGTRRVPVDQINDPLSILGDPAGYPRQLLFELRPVQFVHTPVSVLALFMFEKRWRAIWTDGRKLPTDPDPRWYGYSVGRWEDDYNFIVNSNGTDERTWLDNGGNPHSDQMQVEERWHRISERKLELTVTITDPKAYMRSWIAIDKMRFVQIPLTTDLMEMINAASEAQTVAANFKANEEKSRDAAK